MNRLKYILILGILMIPNMLFAACEHGYFGSGKGTQESPYLVSNESDLKHVQSHSAQYYFKQTANITVTTELANRNSGIYLRGWYDGNNKIINNAYTSRLQIFSVCSEGSEIKDLVITGNPIINVCSSNSGTISNVINYANISVDGNNGGGIVRDNNATGIVKDCRNEGTIDAGSITWTVGGIVGFNRGIVMNCSNKAAFTGGGHRGSENPNLTVGGIVGSNRGKVINCYNEFSTVEKTDYFSDFKVGGIVGSQYEGSIENCYSLDINIIKNKYTIPSDVRYGILGGYLGGSIKNSYYLDRALYGIGRGTTGYDSGTIKYTDTQMQSTILVQNLNNSQTPIVWKKGNGTYPYPIFIGELNLNFTSNTLKIGDNTNAQFTINYTDNIDIIELYNTTTKETIYKGIPQKQVSVPINHEGINQIIIRGYDSGNNLLVQASLIIEVDKLNVLSNLLHEINTNNGLDKHIIINGNNRYFDDNIENRLLVSKIKDEQIPVYIIYTEISQVLEGLLER